ncbi:disulfide reductase [Sulfolobales archaeon HS-7]|nr:disulfide reductase [Sulfolobales archaeon HS-7]
MKIAYYPGCATHGYAHDVDTATKIVAETLGIELVEVDDWNCCGGGFLDEKDPVSHVALNLRNLSQVEKMGFNKMTTPCSVCLHSHRKAEVVYKEDTNLRRSVDERIKETSVKYSGNSTTEHLVWILVRDVGVETIKSRVKKPLTGIRVAAFYGCQMLRPSKYLGFEDPFTAKSLETLIQTTGATPVTFPMRSACCGFPLMGSNEKGALRLAFNVLNSAKQMNSDLLVHPCSLCHLQMDITQEKVKAEFNLTWRLPAIYITQLLGLAFGYSADELEIPKYAREVLTEKGYLTTF